MFAVTYTTGLLCWSYYGIKLNILQYIFLILFHYFVGYILVIK